MKLSQKHFRIRLMLLIIPLMVLFMLIAAFYVYKSEFIPKDQQEKDTFIIEKIYSRTYVEERGFFKRDLKHENLIIELHKQPFSVVLSEDYFSKAWRKIERNFSKGDTIEILYIKQRLEDGTLHNPSEVKINRQTIISFNQTKELNLYLLGFILLMIFISVIVFKMAYNTYKADLIKGDQVLYKKSKWKLIGRWFGE
jgi:hypothetical protein